ncbi:SMC family ATPase [Bacillus tianshenii]|nr:SMC family ATPase [Bacillus tianshenii]
MRPIHLTIAGLHSFREKQEVQFDELTKGGVFGIFGPTGSGKSSLLDAMTLALYGKVERASNNTQGILNHAEDTLDVGFTFELGNAKTIKRYRVERRFKRSGDVNIRTSTCRLIDLTDKTIVLAEKAGDVNQHIETILGLTIDDFTRAVVLPQGKFAEFLSLKGSERRQMLQRLFHLEQYGDKLNQKLRIRIQSVEGALREIEAEKTGLGDASKEALQQAEEDLKVAEKHLQTKQTELERVQNQYEEAKEIRQYQEQRETVEQKLESLQQQSPQVEQLKKRLEQAEKAEALTPYLEELKAAEIQFEHAQKEKKRLEETLKISKQAYEESEKKYTELKEVHDQQVPKYSTQIEQLKGALEEKQRLLKFRNERRKLEADIESLEKTKKEKKQVYSQTEAIKQKGEQKQRQLKEERNKVNVTVEERENIQAASELKQVYDLTNKQVKEINGQVEAKQAAYSEQAKAHELVEQQLKTTMEKLQETFIRNEQVYARICKREREWEKLSYSVSTFIMNKKKQLDNEKAKQLASQLVHGLEDGKPCPVCGSDHHPAPSSTELHQVEQLTSEIHKLEEVQQQFQAQQHQLSAHRSQLEQFSSELTEQLAENVPQSISVDEEKSLLEENLTSVEDFITGMKTLITECKALGQDMLELQQLVRKYIRTFQEQRQQQTHMKHRLDTLNEDITRTEEQQKEVSETLKAKHQQWEQRFSGLSFEEVEKRKHEINEKDRLAAEYNQRIEKSIPFLEQKEKELNKLQTELYQVENNHAIAVNTLNNKAESEKELIGRIEKQAPLDKLEDVLKQTEKELEQLRQATNEAYEKRDTNREAYNRIQTEMTEAETTFSHANTRCTEAKQRWEEKQSVSSFSSIQEVQAAHINNETKQEWKQRIEAHGDAMREQQSEFKKIKARLQDRFISIEQWNELLQQRSKLQEEVSDAQQQKGSRLNTLQEVKRKHERYQDLEEEGKKQQASHDNLRKLQNVFRGNTFVEFLAEEQLMHVSKDASERLKKLTRGRYAIEVDSAGGFVIRDDANGGVKRPVSTLSGGETFLTSLALALSLSAQIQLRGEFPLEFFFLDEGFGTLDQELLETVISALEKLNHEQLSVGVISHVPELRERLPRKLIVSPAEPSGKGSSVALEAL